MNFIVAWTTLKSKSHIFVFQKKAENIHLIITRKKFANWQRRKRLVFKTSVEVKVFQFSRKYLLAIFAFHFSMQKPLMYWMWKCCKPIVCDLTNMSSTHSSVFLDMLVTRRRLFKFSIRFTELTICLIR